MTKSLIFHCDFVCIQQTDDQILLLQNCWADLLLFNCCMRSIQSTTEIFLPMGKSIDMEKAERLGHGADDIVSRLLCITEQLRKLQVDQYEFVALKVLMLISPGKSDTKNSDFHSFYGKRAVTTTGFNQNYCPFATK